MAAPTWNAVVLVITLFVAHCTANFNVSNTLGDNMVLQRAPFSANIFGMGDVGINVSVVLLNESTHQVFSADVAQDGTWTVALAPTAAGGPYTIAIATSAGDKATLSNVLFGDVWLCGGQSNMQFTVANGFNASEEIQAADDFPNIRVMSVGQANYSSTPQNSLINVAMPWTVASSKSIGAGQWTEFSAVCWFTGRGLFEQYGVPIGLVSSNWGGTLIQAWSPPSSLERCNVTSSATGNEANSVLYNAMIVPFQKQVIKGVLWYQAEQNWDQAAMYSCVFPAMISDWRANFKSAPDFPFLFVQLAAWAAGSGTYIPDVRQAQLAALALPNVGFATAIDLGDIDSPYGSVHPRDKQDVGKRLTMAARNIAYGETTVVWEGPMFQSASASISNGTATVLVNWKIFGSGGLSVRNASCPQGCPANQCSNWAFLLSGDTRASAWYEANSTTLSISANVVTVQFPIAAPGDQTIAGFRYGYSAWPLLTLFSEQDLPAIPFEVLL